MSEMPGQNRTEVPGATVITTRSELAVLLIVQKSGTEQYTGAFLGSDEARKIAHELLAFADEADAVPIPTDEEREIILARFTETGKFVRLEDLRAEKAA